MIGAIVGDVIGSPYEFNNWRDTDFRVFAPESQCTDDSILTVATADALLDGQDYQRMYQDYFHRFPNAGYGGMFVKWANRRESQPYNSWGNGSAMRVGPVGWAKNSLDEVLQEAERTARVTHDHPEGILGAQAAAGCVFLARTEQKKERLKEFLEAGCGYSMNRSIEEIRKTSKFDVSCRGTVPVAIQAVLESTDFESAIRLAVSAGGDSDTIACIAGAVAQALYGSMPDEWVKKVMEVYLDPACAEVVLRFCEQYKVRI